MKRLTCLTCLFLLLLMHHVGAETVEEKLNPSKKNEPTTQQVDGSSNVVTGIKVVVSLVVLIGGFLLVARFINERTRGVRQSSRLSHLGGIPLGKDRSVQLVKVQGKIYVVGVGQTLSCSTRLKKRMNGHRQLMYQTNHIRHMHLRFWNRLSNSLTSSKRIEGNHDND